MSLQTITINTSLSADGFKSVCDLAPGGLPAVVNLSNYFASVPDQQPALLTVNVGAVQASGTITSTGTAANNETMRLANVVITAKTSGAVAADGQFNISATPATQAASIAAAINAVPALSGVVTASAVAGVVTVTSVVPGIVGNAIECIDVNLANVTVVGMSGGSAGTTYTLDLR